MKVHRNGQGTLQSVPWRALLLVKTQDGIGNPREMCLWVTPHVMTFTRLMYRINLSLSGRSVTERSIRVVLILKRIDDCYVQQIRWKGGSTRLVRGMSGRYKFLWKCPKGICALGDIFSRG